MRHAILLGIVLVCLLALGWLIWNNRQSEKLVTTSISLIVAALVAAILNVVVFSQGTTESTEFLSIFLIRASSGLPVALPWQVLREYPAAVGEIWMRLSKEDLSSLKVGDAQGQQDLYLQILQWEIVTLLQRRYGQSWRVKTPAFRWPTGTNDFNMETWAPDTSAGGVVMAYATARSVLLPANLLARDGIHPTTVAGAGPLSLPPGIAARGWINVTDPTKPKQAIIVFESNMLTLRISVEEFQYSGVIGAYGYLLNQFDASERKQMAKISFVVRIETVTKGLYQGNPRLPPLKSWAMQVTQYLQESLDANAEWTRVQDLLQLQHLMAPHPSNQ